MKKESMVKLTKNQQLKLKGLFGLLILPCKCEERRYMGGKVVIKKHLYCNVHKNGFYFRCGVCNNVMSKAELKKHKWTHAV